MPSTCESLVAATRIWSTCGKRARNLKSLRKMCIDRSFVDVGRSFNCVIKALGKVSVLLIDSCLPNAQAVASQDFHNLKPSKGLFVYILSRMARSDGSRCVYDYRETSSLLFFFGRATYVNLGSSSDLPRDYQYTFLYALNLPY